MGNPSLASFVYSVTWNCIGKKLTILSFIGEREELKYGCPLLEKLPTAADRNKYRDPHLDVMQTVKNFGTLGFQ